MLRSFLTALAAMLFAAVLAPSITRAQNTEQDFEATFFPDPTILPPAGPPPDFLPVQCGTAPIGAVRAGDWAEVGDATQFFRLAYEVNSQLNGLMFNQAHTGAYGELIIEFDVRFSPGIGGGADGLSVAYLNAADPPDGYGADNYAPGICFSEEPMLAGSLGVGFDTYNNAGDGGESSVSVHFDNVLVANVALDDILNDPPFDITSLETGVVYTVTIIVTPDVDQSLVTINIEDQVNGLAIQPFLDLPVPGMTPYDGRLAFGARTGGANSNEDLDNIVLTVDGNPVLEEDFDDFEIPPPPTVRFDQYNTDPNGEVRPDSEGWDGQFARVGHTVANQSNVMSFPQVYEGAYDELLLEFDFRFCTGRDEEGNCLFVPGTDNGADGFGVGYLSVADYGSDTTTPVPFFSEEANLVNSLGVGLDIWENGGEGLASISVHFNGAVVASQPLDLLPISDLESGTPMRCEIFVEGSLVTITLIDLEEYFTNEPVVVFDQLDVVGLTPYDGRLAFSARTGGANADQDADNIRLTIDGEEKLFEDFESFEVVIPPTVMPPEPTGGTPYSLVRFGVTPDPTVLPDDGQLIRSDGVATVKPGYLRLIHEVGNQINICAFDQTSDSVGTITADFKLRGRENSPGSLGRADGVSFLLIPVETYGDSGASLIPNFNPMEEPNLAGAFGVGFDTYNSGAGDGDSDNSISVHWNGAILANQTLDRAEFDLVNGEYNEVHIEVYQVTDGYNASVSLVDGTDDSEHVVFQDLEVPGMTLDPTGLAMGARVLFAGRTGGAADNYEFDDVVVSYSDSTRLATVRRSFAPSTYADATTPVQVMITVDDLNAADAPFDLDIQDMLPAGWTASNATMGGAAAGEMASWALTGITDDVVLSYTATPADGDQSTGVFGGTFTIAGETRAIGGASDVLYAPAPFPIGQETVLVDGLLGDEGACPDGFQCNSNGGFDPVSGAQLAFAPSLNADGQLVLIQDAINTTTSSVLMNTGPVDLTENAVRIEGTVYFANDPVDAQAPADGMTICFLDPTVNDEFSLGGTGEFMGYGNIGTGGFAVEFDGWVNANDPSGYNSPAGEDPVFHIGAIKDGVTTDHIQTNYDLPEPFVLPNIVDEGLFTPISFILEYNNGNLSVTMSGSAAFGQEPFDDQLVLDTTVTFPAGANVVLPSAIIGFTGGTGGANMTAALEDIRISTFARSGGGGGFRRGDTDASGVVDISDPIFNLTFQFVGGIASLPCADAADVDDSGLLDISDPIYNLTFQFVGGIAPPPAPGPTDCGSDPSGDGLDCVAYPQEKC